jgi:hypothetical protein
MKTISCKAIRLADLRRELRIYQQLTKKHPKYAAQVETLKRQIAAELGSGVVSLYSRQPMGRT